MCVPDVNSDLILTDGNVNMITCGGQASMPMLHLISKHCTGLEYVEIVSQIASKSAGMATRINVDNYIATTRKAITKFTGCKNTKVILNLNPAEPCVDMQTTIFIKTKDINFNNLTEEIAEKIEELKTYIPYYELILPPTMNENGVVVLSIRVKGTGDYLPEYAGNLDIIKSIPSKRIIRGEVITTSEISVVSETTYKTNGESCIIVRNVVQSVVILDSKTTDHIVVKSMTSLTILPDTGKIDEEYDEVVVDKFACIEFRFVGGNWYILSSDGLKQS